MKKKIPNQIKLDNQTISVNPDKAKQVSSYMDYVQSTEGQNEIQNMIDAMGFEGVNIKGMKIR